MSLERYRSGRVVALHPDTSVYAAMRAMQANQIGAVVIVEHGLIVGIATDRDLGREVITFDEDPFALRLGSVMSRPVHTVAVWDTPLDAARNMRERRVRRLPIVSANALVGIVTLDDLIADQAVPADELAAVVRAQFAAPAGLGPAEPERLSDPA